MNTLHKKWNETPVGHELYIQGNYEKEKMASVYGGKDDGWFFCVPYYNGFNAILLKAMSLKEAKVETESIIRKELMQEFSSNYHYAQEITKEEHWEQDTEGDIRLKIHTLDNAALIAVYVFRDASGGIRCYFPDYGLDGEIFDSTEQGKIYSINKIKRDKEMENKVLQNMIDALR